MGGNCNRKTPPPQNKPHVMFLQFSNGPSLKMSFQDMEVDVSDKGGKKVIRISGTQVPHDMRGKVYSQIITGLEPSKKSVDDERSELEKYIQSVVDAAVKKATKVKVNRRSR